MSALPVIRQQSGSSLPHGVYATSCYHYAPVLFVLRSAPRSSEICKNGSCRFRLPIPRRMRHLAIILVILSLWELCLSKPSGLPGRSGHRDSDTDSLTRAAVLTRLLERLDRALQQLDGAVDEYQEHQMEENSLHERDWTPEVTSKRKTFWQPMGGPLPVATRFTAFGSRIEPDRVQASDKGGIKAMRYGRRR